MDWTHLFVSNEDPGGDNGTSALDTDPSLLVATSDFFEYLPIPPPSLPPRPPSIPADLEPAPLFPPTSDPSNTLEAAFLSAQQSYNANTLGLCFDGGSAALSSTQADRQQGQPVLQPASNTLFDSKEESYLNSFLSGFDMDGLDIPPYLPSPLPMANFSSRTEYLTGMGMGMGMGMGLGAGMMGAMDDAIPHLSLGDSRHDAAADLAHMVPSSLASISGAHSRAAAAEASMPMRRQTSMLDYGLGSTSHLPPGNAMSEEMHKVSSWLLQSQNHHGEPPHPQSVALPDMHQPLSHYPSLSSTAAMMHVGSLPANAPASISNLHYHQQSQNQRLGALGMAVPAALSPTPHTAAASTWRGSFADDASMQSPRPPSESDISIKRKASFEQLDQPRKTRGNIRSPIRDGTSPFSANAMADGIHLTLSRPPAILGAASAGSIAARRSIPHGVFGAGRETRQTEPGIAGEEVAAPGSGASDDDDDEEGSNNATAGKGARRKESKKNTSRAVLTEEERRANHIASEQRRRNQIRHGYAELMTLVTTLRDPALGNHPGTAHSTPSKAVILAHAVQFIRGLEEGNRMLRKRLEQSRHIRPPPLHALSAFRPGSPQQQ